MATPGGVPRGAPSTICRMVRSASWLASSERVTAHAVAHDEQMAEARDLLTDGVLVDLLVRVATRIRALRDFELGS